MGRNTTVLLRVLQAALAFTNLGLSAYVIQWYAEATVQGPPASLNFLFASCVSLVSLVYLEVGAQCWPHAGYTAVALGVEGLNTIFYFSGFIAYAVLIGGMTLCHGQVCAAGRIDSVAAAAFCAWIASIILAAKALFMGGAQELRRPAGKDIQMVQQP